MNSAFRGETNPKNLNEFSVKTLVITLIDDSHGKENFERVLNQCSTNDFVSVIKIP